MNSNKKINFLVLHITSIVIRRLKLYFTKTYIKKIKNLNLRELRLFYVKESFNLKISNSLNQLNLASKISLVKTIKIIVFLELFYSYSISLKLRSILNSNKSFNYLIHEVGDEFYSLAITNKNNALISINLQNEGKILKSEMVFGDNILIIGPAKTSNNIHFDGFDSIMLVKPSIADLEFLGNLDLSNKRVFFCYNTWKSTKKYLELISKISCKKKFVLLDHYAIHETKSILSDLQLLTESNLAIIIQKRDKIYSVLAFNPFKLHRLLISLYMCSNNQVTIEGFDLYSERTYYRTGYKSSSNKPYSDWVQMDLLSNYNLIKDIIKLFGSRINLPTKFSNLLNNGILKYAISLEIAHGYNYINSSDTTITS